MLLRSAVDVINRFDAERDVFNHLIYSIIFVVII